MGPVGRDRAVGPKHLCVCVLSLRACCSNCHGKPGLERGPRTSLLPKPGRTSQHRGFLLHFGDALSKAGQLEDAREAWGLAAVAPSYATWAYRSDLEARIADPSAHSRTARAGQKGEGMMITSRMS
jgi:hypothetical protein